VNKNSIIAIAGIAGLSAIKKLSKGSLSIQDQLFNVARYKHDMSKNLLNKFQNANKGIHDHEVLGVELTGDSTKLTSIFQENSIDCVITSPPYFDIIKYSKNVENEIGFGQTDKEYVGLLVKTFYPFLKSLKDDGNLVVNLGAKRNQDYILYDFVNCMRAVGWHLQREIIWSKANPAPVSYTGVQPTVEKVYFFSKKGQTPRLYSILQKSKSAGMKVATNPNRIIEGNESVTNRKKTGVNVKTHKVVSSDWHLSNIKTNWSIRDREELFDHHFSHSPIEANYEDEVVKKKHQALMNPVIIRNILWMTTLTGDIVVDPFSGAGTVTQMAKMMGRVGIGVELNKVNSMTAVIGRNFTTTGSDWNKYTLRDNTKNPKVEPVPQDSPLLSVPNTRKQASKKTMYIDCDEFRFSGLPFYFNENKIDLNEISDRTLSILRGIK
jgi:DNA modification methylase